MNKPLVTKRHATHTTIKKNMHTLPKRDKIHYTKRNMHFLYSREGAGGMITGSPGNATEKSSL